MEIDDFDSLIEDECDSEFKLQEVKLLNYLIWVTKLLKCEKNWIIDNLCRQIEHIDLGEHEIEPTLSENDVILKSTEIVNILLSEDLIKFNLEACVQVLLEFIKNKLENYVKNDDIKMVDFACRIVCSFVEICETNKILMVALKNHVTRFLQELFSILETADSTNFLIKGPVYQLVAIKIGYFKNIEFAKSYILVMISKQIKLFSKNLLKPINPNNFDMSLYEILLLHLMVLKDIMEIDLKKLFYEAKEIKKDNKVSTAIARELNKIIGKVPDYVVLSIQQCLNLLLP